MNSNLSNVDNVYYTEKIYLPRRMNPVLIKLAKVCSDVFNTAQYSNRNRFIRRQKVLGQEGLRKYFEAQSKLPSEGRETPGFNYQEVKQTLGSSVAEQSLKLVDNSWKAYFAATKEYQKDPSKFEKKPNIPGYNSNIMQGSKVFTIYLKKQHLRVFDGQVLTPNKIGICIQPKLADINRLAGARIVPMGDRFRFDLLYEINLPTLLSTTHRVGSIDLGIKNLVTIVNNLGSRPRIFGAEVILSICQYYQKETAHLRAIYDRQKISSSKKLINLQAKRDRKLDNAYHTISRGVVDWCLQHQLDTLIIGKNDGWKQQVKLGKRNNQNFHAVAHSKLIRLIAYKAREKGIIVFEDEESYTSKCSFFDNEIIASSSSYLGRRVKRGLFQTQNGTLFDKGTIVNADVNAAYNIGRKHLSRHFPASRMHKFQPEKVILPTPAKKVSKPPTV